MGMRAHTMYTQHGLRHPTRHTKRHHQWLQRAVPRTRGQQVASQRYTPLWLRHHTQQRHTNIPPRPHHTLTLSQRPNQTREAYTARLTSGRWLWVWSARAARSMGAQETTKKKQTRSLRLSVQRLPQGNTHQRRAPRMQLHLRHPKHGISTDGQISGLAAVLAVVRRPSATVGTYVATPRVRTTTHMASRSTCAWGKRPPTIRHTTQKDAQATIRTSHTDVQAWQPAAPAATTKAGARGNTTCGRTSHRRCRNRALTTASQRHTANAQPTGLTNDNTTNPAETEKHTNTRDL